MGAGGCPVVVAQWQSTGCTSQVSWVRFPAAAGLFTFLYFRLITSKLLFSLLSVLLCPKWKFVVHGCKQTTKLQCLFCNGCYKHVTLFNTWLYSNFDSEEALKDEAKFPSVLPTPTSYPLPCSLDRHKSGK